MADINTINNSSDNSPLDTGSLRRSYSANKKIKKKKKGAYRIVNSKYVAGR